MGQSPPATSTRQIKTDCCWLLDYLSHQSCPPRHRRDVATLTNDKNNIALSVRLSYPALLPGHKEKGLHFVSYHANCFPSAVPEAIAQTSFDKAAGSVSRDSRPVSPARTSS